MAIQTIAREMASGGDGHEHIAYLRWQSGSETGWSTRAAIVQYVEKNGDDSVYCADEDPTKSSAWVHVNHIGETKYVQTYADKRWTDNLLHLPKQKHDT